MIQATTLKNEDNRSPVLGAESDPTKLYHAGTKGSAIQSRVASFNILKSEEHARTPLFIAFTRNNDMLVQTVLSYISAGWPPTDVIVVDNSGTMDANPNGMLSTVNPFYLDVKSLLSHYGVSVLQTPTLLTFAQLQNFFLRTAMAYEWPIFFWSHMDVLVLSDETAIPYKSFSEKVLDILGECENNMDAWALKWFAYDHLTMVNVEAWRFIGPWDMFIPYYTADCDDYSRMVMNGYDRAETDAKAGMIFDVASVIESPELLFLPTKAEQGLLNSKRYQRLLAELRKMEKEKQRNPGGRNTRQGVNDKGKGEPWTYDPKGFRRGWWELAEMGKRLYTEKWGQGECNLDSHEGKIEDAWKGEYM